MATDEVHNVSFQKSPDFLLFIFPLTGELCRGLLQSAGRRVSVADFGDVWHL